MFCQHCGAEVAEGTKFCIACGAELSAQQPPIENANQVSEPVAQAPVVEQPAQVQQPIYEQAPATDAPQSAQGGYQPYAAGGQPVPPQQPYEQTQYQQQAQYDPQGYAQPPYGQQPFIPQPNPAPSFGDCIKLYFKNYVNFSGRSRRAEYWYVVLFQIIVSVALSLLSTALAALTDGNTVVSIIMSVLSYGWSLATIIPGLALTIRRLHDIGKSGVYILFALIPIAGSIILLVWEASDSKPEPNEYGYSPKYTPGFVYDKLQ